MRNMCCNNKPAFALYELRRGKEKQPKIEGLFAVILFPMRVVFHAFQSGRNLKNFAYSL